MRNNQDFDSNREIRNQEVNVQQLLQAMPKQAMPEHLRTNLRVIASRERARHIAHKTATATLKTWAASLSLMFDNMMRPFALPFVGGISSAVVMFGILYPTLAPGFHHTEDPAPNWYEEAAVSQLTPFGVSGSGKLPVMTLVLDVTVDEQGRMIGYTVPIEVKPLLLDPVLRRSIENNLLFTRFKPANFFGAPTTGKLRITIQHSQLDVKG